MTSNASVSLLGRMSVGQKMACIPGVFILAIVVLVAYPIWTIYGMLDDSVAADVIGRQRMLNQLHTKQVLMFSQGLAKPGDYGDFGDAGTIMSTTIESLINGGPVQTSLIEDDTETLEPVPSKAIRDALEKQRDRLKAKLTLAANFPLNPDAPDYSAKLDELLKIERELHLASRDARKAYTQFTQGKITSLIVGETVIGVVVTVVGILFSWLISRGVVVPLASVVSMAKNVAQGDLTGEKLQSTASDEVGQLADVFNTMLDSLKTLSRQIHSVTENVNVAATEISASTKQQASSTKEQAATVQEITSTMAEITQSGGQIVDKAKAVATSAEATSAASKAGVQAVQATTRTMSAIREQVEEVAENIVAVSEKTQAVGDIIATVNDIAEQSNLLALNAAIEAAAAGSEGSRFSVVASEMKNLADQAKECTVQVRTILSEIQKGINSSVMLTEEAVKRVETGKQQAEVSESTIREMTETTETSVQAFQQIIGAANQQQIGFEQVTQGMQDIRQAAEQTAAGTEQLEQAVSNLASLSQQLKAAVGTYRI
jgi:methyl-accepting chemotaxis protein